MDDKFRRILFQNKFQRSFEYPPEFEKPVLTFFENISEKSKWYFKEFNQIIDPKENKQQKLRNLSGI